MLGFNGGRLGALNAPSLTSARGIWTSNEQYIARTAGNWPLATDPYWSNVSLLLHFNAANGSTIFTDSSNNAFAPAQVGGNSVVSTAQSKFGGSSLALDGNGDYLGYNNVTAFQFGSGDFTVESWVYFNNIGSNMTLIGSFNTGTGSMTIQHQAVNGWVLKITAGSDVLVTNTLSTASTWQHIAFCRSGSNVRAFLDGTQIGPTIVSTLSFSLSLGSMRIGVRGTTEYMNGYFDDLRITKGVGRYTTNFVPLSYQFPDS